MERYLKYLKCFKLHNKVPSELIEKYKNIVPKKIIDLWQVIL